MEKEFVPYKEAVALKELGFDEECFGYYDIDKGYTNGYAFCYSDVKSQLKNGCSAPLYQQAFRWFREKYNLKSWIQEHTTDTFIYEIRPHFLNILQYV